MSTPRRHHRGFSLVELLVAIAIGGILLAGAISLFVSNRQSYNITTDMSRLQENARFALEMITRDIRMAGFVGCVNDLNQVVDGLGAGFKGAGRLWDASFAVEGYDSDLSGAAQWSPSAAAYPAPAPIAAGVTIPTPRSDSDGITLRYVNVPVDDGEVVTASTASLMVEGREILDAGDIAMVADCAAADLYQVSSRAASTHPSDGSNETDTITPVSSLSRDYTGEDEVTDSNVTPNTHSGAWYGVRYYLANKTDGTPTLYRDTIGLDLSGGAPGTPVETTQELFEGVERMQFLYGVDSDGDGAPNGYYQAEAVGNLDSPAAWSNVVSVRVGLLMRTIDQAAGAQSYTPPALLDVDLGTYNDAFRRRVFTTTVLIRNRQQ